jgi:hypothetical protein
LSLLVGAPACQPGGVDSPISGVTLSLEGKLTPNPALNWTAGKRCLRVLFSLRSSAAG